MKKPKKKDQDRPVVCYYGTPWAEHFDSPMGVGARCLACRQGVTDITTKKET
jgi:hypothetical protein